MSRPFELNLGDVEGNAFTSCSFFPLKGSEPGSLVEQHVGDKSSFFDRDARCGSHGRLTIANGEWLKPVVLAAAGSEPFLLVSGHAVLTNRIDFLPKVFEFAKNQLASTGISFLSSAGWIVGGEEGKKL